VLFVGLYISVAAVLSLVGLLWVPRHTEAAFSG
jgi:hypothetical protein